MTLNPNYYNLQGQYAGLIPRPHPVRISLPVLELVLGLGPKLEYAWVCAAGWELISAVFGFCAKKLGGPVAMLGG